MFCSSSNYSRLFQVVKGELSGLPLWMPNQPTTSPSNNRTNKALTLRTVQTHTKLDIRPFDLKCCECKFTFIAAPSGECLLVVAAIATLHLLTLWPSHLNFWSANKIDWTARTCHVLSTLVWWWYVQWFLFCVRVGECRHTYISHK